jgi:amino acid transporter
VFNGNFVAATRLLFAFGRRGTIPKQFAVVHAVYLTPTIAIFGACIGTLIGLLIGDALLVPVTEVGALASSLGWLAACSSFFLVTTSARLRIIAGLGIAISLLLTLMKLVPAFPGHFSLAEWIALAIWLALGLAFYRRRPA